MIAKIISFEDHGQDFLEFHIDIYGNILYSFPFQTSIWSKYRVIDHDSLQASSWLEIQKIDNLKESCKIKYPIENIREVKYVPAGKITYGVYFQFYSSGPVCTALNRYIKNGLQLYCMINNKCKVMHYKTVESACNRLLILREDINASAKQRERICIVRPI